MSEENRVTGNVQLSKDTIDIIAKGVQLLLQQKQTLYKRMGVPQSLEAIKDYELKLIEISNIEVLLKQISNSSCIVITPPEGQGINTPTNVANKNTDDEDVDIANKDVANENADSEGDNQ